MLMRSSCRPVISRRLRRMSRVRSWTLVICFLSVADALDDDFVPAHVEEDSEIPCAEPVVVIVVGEALDVAVKAGLEPVNLAKDLCGDARRQFLQISQGGFSVV